MAFRLLSYNIRQAGRGREELLAAVVNAVRPDMVMLQEAFRPAMVDRLAQSSGMPVWGARPGASLAFLSRVAVNSWEWHAVAGVKHSFMEVRMEAVPWVAFGVHLFPSLTRWGEGMRIREIRALVRTVAEQQVGTGGHVLVGDFNAIAPGDRVRVSEMPAWLRGLLWLGGRGVPREAIGALLANGYADAYREMHPGREGHTLPAHAPRVRLDYAFLAAGFTGTLSNCEVVSAPAAVTQASDHLPLQVDFVE